MDVLSEYAAKHPWRVAAGAAAAIVAAQRLWRAFQPAVEPPEGAVVLVTGCDTGIANQTAKLLSELKTKDGQAKYKVLAGCLTPKGIEELAALGRPNLVTFTLDVTSEESVKAMRKLAEEHCDGNGLFALYNIAGVGMGSFFDLTTMDEYRRTMEVNFFGVVRVTQALYHLLHRSAHLARLAAARGRPVLKPRIVTVSSVASELPGPNVAYAASKHAAKAFCNGLRAEASAFGIEVIEVRPFYVATNIVPTKENFGELVVKQGLAAKFGDPGPNAFEKDPYGAENPVNRYVGGLDALARNSEKMLQNMDTSKMMTARYIAERMAEQMESERPRNNIMLSNSLGDYTIYHLMRHVPDFLMGVQGRAMRSAVLDQFVVPVQVEKVGAGQVLEARPPMAA
ncbi:hypothetical protein DFJ74DRAFT_641873 [Hyaloraphidium curvatum]|nr:hypothetical protein DFJ74DRAFT_641873 [Hyaloraphidium curvatum]